MITKGFKVTNPPPLALPFYVSINKTAWDMLLITTLNVLKNLSLNKKDFININKAHIERWNTEISNSSNVMGQVITNFKIFYSKYNTGTWSTKKIFEKIND